MFPFTYIREEETPMKAGLKIAAAVLTLALFAPSAHAQFAPFVHDGFLLRLAMGLGEADSEIDGELGGADVEFDGTAGDWNVAIGGVVAENLAIHGTFFGFWIDDPDQRISDGGSVTGG